MGPADFVHQQEMCFGCLPFERLPNMQREILLMAEILHHLGYIKPRKKWDKLPINWCRISAINSSYSTYNLSSTKHIFWTRICETRPCLKMPWDTLPSCWGHPGRLEFKQVVPFFVPKNLSLFMLFGSSFLILAFVQGHT